MTRKSYRIPYAGSVSTFSVSAILILSPDKDPAAGVAYGGFIYLIVGIILIVVIPRN
jgi:hypothetical protein